MVVRRLAKGRVPYEKLRARLIESRLPFDYDAERLSIGAVLLAPNGWARKLSGKLYAGHFYDPGYGWLWEELGTALLRRKLVLDDAEQIDQWLTNSKLVHRFRERFNASALRFVAPCFDGCFWYWGRWYIDRVLVAAKLRAAVIREARLLTEALDRAEAWEQKR